MSCECMNGGFFCGRCSTDDAPKLSGDYMVKVKCQKCGHEVEDMSMRDAMHKWEEKVSTAEAKR